MRDDWDDSFPGESEKKLAREILGQLGQKDRDKLYEIVLKNLAFDPEEEEESQ